MRGYQQRWSFLVFIGVAIIVVVNVILYHAGQLPYFILRGEVNKVKPDNISMMRRFDGIDVEREGGEGFIELKDLSLFTNTSFYPHYTNKDELEPHRMQNLSYHEALKQVADPDGVVLLSFIDGGFLPMAINFYLTCIAVHSISNYLFLATDQATCDYIPNINCMLYRTDEGAWSPSVYNTPQFRRKLRIRTELVLEALQLGYKVLNTDVDIYCSRHPITHINCRIGECDMTALRDDTFYNSGFIYINPTEASKQVYMLMTQMAKENITANDQLILNIAIREVKDQRKKSKLKDESNLLNATELSTEKFQCGKLYYGKAPQYYPGRCFPKDLQTRPCPQCVVIHNNWILEMEAKRYRFKELHQWFYDGVQQYYTSLGRRYMIYDNPFVDANAAPQLEALNSAMAIGQILNRTVILPQFHCKFRDCPLSSLVSISRFDQQFGEGYRESSFLSHPLVPKQIVDSEAGPYLIMSKFVKDHLTESMALTHVNNKRVVTITPRSEQGGLTEEEIILHFKNITHRVIRFAALYEALVDSSTKHRSFLSVQTRQKGKTDKIDKTDKTVKPDETA
eukprot:GHVN01004348.1.p1 GENE.GHVN01004348.1~~GHVN01004348.1.p1  ORF type:complete len:567 (+),score=54.48 GHVN01004348.1:107-1807(+)